MRIPGGRDKTFHAGAGACLAAAIVVGACFVSSAAGSTAAQVAEPTGLAATTTTTTPSDGTGRARGTSCHGDARPPMETSPPMPVAAVAEQPARPVTTENATDVTAPADTAVETTVATPTTVVAPEQPIDIPETVEPTVAEPTNQSTCRTDLPGAVMAIAMPDISYWCPVYAGGQSVIDAGVATVITANQSSFALAATPGAAGTLWITGHRSSHGGPFAAVPDLVDGAIITVSDEGGSASYVIVGRSYVEVRDGLAVDASGQTTESATLDAVLRPDRNADLAPRLLLQTCDAENFRWMIYADLIEG